MELTNEQRTALKGKGYITMKDGLHFSCRVVISAGKISALQAQKITEVCQAYGKGYFTITHRANVQIPWVQYEDLDNVAKSLEAVGLSIGGTGPRVRPAHNCKGPVCRFHLYDTETAAEQINERFYKGYYDNKLPGKFRIQLSGCPNNCAKTQLGCVSLQGRRPNQVAISIGGMSGRNTVIGKEIAGLYSIPEAMDMIETALQFYKENGLPGERFAKLVDRIGFENVEKALLGN